MGATAASGIDDATDEAEAEGAADASGALGGSTSSS